jgi:outer membrane protein assembly factor BamA
VAAAQPTGSVPVGTVRTYVDGRQVNRSLPASFPLDSLEVEGRREVDKIRTRGFLYARLDSVAYGPSPAIYVSRGSLVRIGEIRIEASSQDGIDDPEEFLRVRVGDPFDPSVVELDLVFLLDAYNRAGYPFAEARIAGVELVPGDDQRVRLTLELNPGDSMLLDHIQLPGAARTKAGYVGRITGMRPGRTLTDFDPEEIRRSLLATDFFDEVGRPTLARGREGSVIVVIPIEESAPGSFDLVMGYTPRSSAGQSGGLVGTGRLDLRNLFGGGRSFDLRLNRLPGRVSTVDVGFADPGILRIPVGLEGRFNGVQQDSTYDQQRYALNLSYSLSRNLRVVAGASREVTKPGQAGLRLRAGTQRIPRSTASFVGIGIRFESVDWPVNPRRGLAVETMFERGNKNRTGRRADVSGDTLTERTRSGQERLRVEARYYVPIFQRQVVTLGVDARLVLSDEYDESDLIRFGGANSLRGYNEEQYLGRLAGRAVVEFRYQLDRYAYAFVFTDMGILEVPETPELEAVRQLLPGFGFGIQFRTPVGLINATYAFNDSDSPVDGRVHVGLSFSL